MSAGEIKTEAKQVASLLLLWHDGWSGTNERCESYSSLSAAVGSHALAPSIVISLKLCDIKDEYGNDFCSIKALLLAGMRAWLEQWKLSRAFTNLMNISNTSPTLSGTEVAVHPLPRRSIFFTSRLTHLLSGITSEEICYAEAWPHFYR